MAVYKTPGVYVEEIATLPPSVAEVETAIPVFIGFTEKGPKNVPKRISSLVEYQLYFGGAMPETNFTVSIQGDNTVNITVDKNARSKFVMFYAMQLYFANGGGPCYIVSVGNFDLAAPGIDVYQAALDVCEKEDEPTLIVFPDAPYLLKNYNDLIVETLQHCSDLGDRFTIIDVLHLADVPIMLDDANAFRNINTSTKQAKYGAAYYPAVSTTIAYVVDETKINVTMPTETKPAAAPVVEVDPTPDPPKPGRRERATAEKSSTVSFDSLSNAQQNLVRLKFREVGVELYPSAAIAGIYARVDSSRGVWKAPANEAINFVKAPLIKITDEQQKDLNIHDSGKSINAIRAFTGKGTKIWGARTLSGNDNEWRYVNIRRFFNMVEESVKKSTSWAVFEPNDINTWIKVRAMIENYLILKWKDGALAGAKPNEAFFVRVGLGQTMSAEDVLEGKMIVEIGLAAVRPAEFIILKFSHKLQVA
jgi:phage tail sheath protein FI